MSDLTTTYIICSVALAAFISVVGLIKRAKKCRGPAGCSCEQDLESPANNNVNTTEQTTAMISTIMSLMPQRPVIQSSSNTGGSEGHSIGASAGFVPTPIAFMPQNSPSPRPL